MKKTPKIDSKKRSLIVGILFCLFFAVLGTKAAYLQIFQRSWLSEKVTRQVEKSQVNEGKRGIIYDAKHNELAVSIQMTSIGAFPSRIKEPWKTARALTAALDIENKTLYRRLTSQRSFAWIKRQITPREEKIVRDLRLEGIDFVPEKSRFYPNKTLAAQVLGFSGIDGHGLEGLEFEYNDYLAGSRDEVTILKDARGKKFTTPAELMPDNSGFHLIMTVDKTIQYIAENALKEAVTQFSGQTGIAIVMAPRTGAILALAHYPFFNPNVYQDFSKKRWRNRAITDPFEPGSTMKVFTAAAALEFGNISADQIFFGENGAYQIGANTVHDTKPHGWLSLQQIIKYSSNIGAIKVSEAIGPLNLYQALRNFGFGEKSGIDCPGETAGRLSHYKRWSKIDAGAIAFGQGISVSAIQLISAVSAIANDGVLMKPYIVQAVVDRNGRLIRAYGPKKIKQAVSPSTSRAVKKMMAAVVTQGGTGTQAALEQFSVAGKTGTAQKIDAQGKYAEKKFIASFVGFAPVENPELAILVVVDEPQRANYGGVVAAPAFRKIAQETLNYLNIPARGLANRPSLLQAGSRDVEKISAPMEIPDKTGQLNLSNGPRRHGTKG
ncbi:MAG: penicillin-binding protein 2 [Desulfobacterales bacterium]|nr:penicillin-binding protein 2 [Desulfobacterales bacterium]